MRTSEQIYDEYLVASAVTGDRPALERLVARWQPRLLAHAWRVLGDPDRALCKSYMGSHLEANRMLRELKRLELQVAMLRTERSG